VATYQKTFVTVAHVTLRTGTVGNQLEEASDVKVRGVIVGEVRAVHAGLQAATIDLAIGGLLLALAVVVARWPRWHPARQQEHRRSPAHLTPPAAFAFGLFSMATNVTTLALVVPAAKEIAAESVPAWGTVVAATILVALATLPAWAPVALAATAPGTAHRLLDALQQAIHRHGRLIVAGVITAAGLFLVVRGIVRLVEAQVG